MTFLDKLEKKTNDLRHELLPYLMPASSLKVECPFCGWKGPSFLPNGILVRKNARCPRCNSLERHRLYYMYLKDVIPTGRPIKVLHFAPEKILINLFRGYDNIEYLSADLEPGKAMVTADITRTPFDDNSFDLIFCSHVLEHVPNDRMAMNELYRILNPSGFAILQVPIRTHVDGMPVTSTYEDFTITDPSEREKAFGQRDHVRIYGPDFLDRLQAAKFDVSLVKFVEELGEAKRKKYCLVPDHPSASETEGWIYHCTK